MSTKIRVLYTIPNFNTSGSGKSVYDLVKRIDRSVFEPEICCYNNKGEFYKKVADLGVKIHIFTFVAHYRPWISIFSRVSKISKFFKANRYDLIHSWNWSSDFTEPLAAKLAGIPYVYTKKAMGWESRYWSWKSKLSSKIIVVNEDMVNLYFSKMLNKIEKFPLAIDTSYYKPSEMIAEFPKDIQINEDDFVVLSIANMVEVKGIEILLEATKRINNNNVKTLIVGNDKNDYGKFLKEKYNDDDNILFLGKQLDVIPYLKLAHVFVIPTKDEGRREGIPNAPLEAMALECVVLGSNISGINDILKKFPKCLFKASDIDELAEKIVAIKNMTAEERHELGCAMRANVVEEFSIEKFLENHETLYLKMVN